MPHIGNIVQNKEIFTYKLKSNTYIAFIFVYPSENLALFYDHNRSVILAKIVTLILQYALRHKSILLMLRQKNKKNSLLLLL